MIACYSDRGCQDFILPHDNNLNYSLTLDCQVLGIPENVTLYMDVVEGKWRFQGISENATINNKVCNTILGESIKKGDTLNIQVGVSQITIIAFEVDDSFVGFVKYDLREVSKITIGSSEENTIVCLNNPYVSKVHAEIAKNNGIDIITDYSRNGVFINGKRVKREQSLAYGDVISFFGVQVVWLGDIIAIETKYGRLHCQMSLIKYHNCNHVDFQHEESKYVKKDYFRRSPRSIPKLYAENIEIDAPPQPQASTKRPLILTIGPSLTMAIPMIVGTGLAILGARGGGSSANTYMYTGIIIAVLSAIIGSIWAVVNIVYTKKQEAEAEKLRQQKYNEYLLNVEKDIAEKYSYNEQSLNYLYQSSRKCCTLNESSSELWNRNSTHSDFLFVRLGIGSLKFQCNITVPKQKFSLIDDPLSLKPMSIANRFKFLKKVPVGIDLAAKRLVGVVAKDHESAMKVVRNNQSATFALGQNGRNFCKPLEYLARYA